VPTATSAAVNPWGDAAFLLRLLEDGFDFFAEFLFSSMWVSADKAYHAWAFEARWDRAGRLAAAMTTNRPEGRRTRNIDTTVQWCYIELNG